MKVPWQVKLAEHVLDLMAEPVECWIMGYRHLPVSP